MLIWHVQERAFRLPLLLERGRSRTMVLCLRRDDQKRNVCAGSTEAEGEERLRQDAVASATKGQKPLVKLLLEGSLVLGMRGGPQHHFLCMMRSLDWGSNHSSFSPVQSLVSAHTGRAVTMEGRPQYQRELVHEKSLAACQLSTVPTVLLQSTDGPGRVLDGPRNSNSFDRC